MTDFRWLPAAVTLAGHTYPRGWYDVCTRPELRPYCVRNT